VCYVPGGMAQERQGETEMSSSDRNMLVDISGELVPPLETEKAWRFFDGARTVWLPKSQCEWDPDGKVMVMPVWLAKDKELI
jgi:hypothetical protein